MDEKHCGAGRVEQGGVRTARLAPGGARLLLLAPIEAPFESFADHGVESATNQEHLVELVEGSENDVLVAEFAALEELPAACHAARQAGRLTVVALVDDSEYARAETLGAWPLGRALWADPERAAERLRAILPPANPVRDGCEHERMLDEYPGVVCRLAADGTTLYVNRAGEELTGYSREELVGRSWWDVFYPGDSREQVKRREEEFGSGGLQQSVMTLVARGGEPRRVAWSSVVRLGPNGKIAELIGFGADVTEHLHDFEALRDSERRYRRFFESSSDAHIMLDGERILDCNEAAVKLFGARDRDELRRHHPFEVSPPRQPDGQQSRRKSLQMIALARRKGAARFEWMHRRTDGDAFPAEVSLTAIELAGRSLVHAVVRDLSAKKAAEDALRRSEHKYRQLVENAPVGVFTTLIDGRMLYANDALLTLTGHDLSRLETEGVAPLYVEPEDRSQLLHDLVDKGVVRNREIVMCAADGGQVPVMLSATLDGDRLSGMIVDLSERVRAEEENRRLEIQLRQSQKMEAVGQLAGGVAHDFNNILTAIFGAVDMALELTKRGDDVELAREMLEQIRESSQRAAGLTRQLLAFSRREVAEPEVQDLGRRIEEMAPMLRRLVRENIELELELASLGGAVQMNTGQLEQIVLNLVVNASDAMPRGGVIGIATRRLDVEREPLSGDSPAEPHFVELRVCDTGAGIPEADQERIFEPFYTTKSVGKGTGLGLATVYGIVRKAGGDIDVESAPGQGATFRVLLPAIAPSETDDAATEKKVATSEGRGQTLLLCEDDDALRRLAEQVLRGAGYEVLVAERGERALALAEGSDAEIALLVTDVIMPGLNGRELADALHESRPGVPVLYVSGYSADVIGEQGALGPDATLLEKPFRPLELIQRVQELIPA